MHNISVVRRPRIRATIVCAVATAILGGDALAQTLELEEIIVTARKREESLQDIPVAVTAFTSADIARRGITELEDVALYTPGLVFEDFASSFSAAPTLRGLTQINVSSEVQNVATFVDSIYIQRNYAVDISGADVQRIEVVKGPQSALYGQNAFAGAINYVLNRPGEELDGTAEVTGGTDGRLEYRVALGGPLIDGKLGLRGSFYKSEFDGTWENEYPGLSKDQARMGNTDNQTVSLIASVTPTEWLELNATYMEVDRQVGIRAGYNINTGDVQNTGNCGLRNAAPPASNGNPRFICGELSIDPDAYRSAASTRPRGAQVLYLPTPGFRNETAFLNFNAEARFAGAFELVYHYGKVDSLGQEISSNAVNALAPSFGPNLNLLATGMFVPGFFNNGQKEGSRNDFRSHELRLDYAPENGPLTATFGLYRSEFDDTYRFALQSVPVGQFVVDSTVNYLDITGFPFRLRDLNNLGETSAIFGALSYRLGKLTLRGELRYSKEEKAVRDLAANITLTDEFKDFIPRITADYRLAEDVLVYFSAGKGLKTGGFNGVLAGSVTIPIDEQAFGPEENVTYEIGAKSTLFDSRLILNAALFHVDWKDMQVQALPSNTPAALFANTPVIFRNLGDARSRGIEVETIFAITEGLTANFGFALTDPKYKHGTLAFRFKGQCDGVVCPLDFSVGGKTLPRTAKTQLVGGMQYVGKFGNDLGFFVRGDVVYQSEMQAEEMNMAQISPRTLVNARASLTRGIWELSLWGKNVFDEEYVANSFFIVQGVGYGAAYGEKASFGATLSVKF